MTVETAVFVVQRGATQLHCAGSDLTDKLQDGDILAVQQNSATAQHWVYRNSKEETTEGWQTQDKEEMEKDLGLVPERVSRDGYSFEADMLRGDDNTLYFFYYQYLLKSINGLTWEIVNSDLPFVRWGIGQSPAAGDGWTTQCSYIDGNMFVNYLNHIWKSSDNGVTWNEVADYQSHHVDKFDVRVKKAFHKASGTSMLFFATSKYDKTNTSMVYSLDVGETWTLFRPTIKKGRWINWQETKQQFLVLTQMSDIDGGDSIYILPWDAVINSQTSNYQLAVKVPSKASYNHEIFVITPELIIADGNFCIGYVLDHDFNILAEAQTSAKGCSWHGYRHCTHLQYDPVADDVLFGDYRRKSNSTSRPQSGRFHLEEMNNGDLCPPEVGVNSQDRNSSTMVYHTPTKRYYQATLDGVFYSPEQEPGDDEFLENTVTKYTTNLDEVNDDALLCCTDTDDTTYKVTGAQFKNLIDPKLPWDDYLEPILHLKNATEMVSFNGGLDIECYDMKGNLVRTSGKIYPGEELVILCQTDFHLYFFGETGNWDFGELTDTSSVTDMSEMFFGATGFNSDTIALFDTSKVETTEGMFRGATKFNGDVSGWDVSKVTDMHSMFYEAEEFNQNINNWDVSNVTDMHSMFGKAYVYDQPLDTWDISNVVAIQSMFSYCNAFNQDIGTWDTSKVIDMERTLYGAWQFVQDLSQWCVDPVPAKSNFAKGSGIEREPAMQPQWGTCP